MGPGITHQPSTSQHPAPGRGKLLVLHQCDASSLLCDVWMTQVVHCSILCDHSPGSVILPVVTRQFLMMPGHCAMINDGQPGPSVYRDQDPSSVTLRAVSRDQSDSGEGWLTTWRRLSLTTSVRSWSQD